MDLKCRPALMEILQYDVLTQKSELENSPFVLQMKRLLITVLGVGYSLFVYNSTPSQALHVNPPPPNSACILVVLRPPSRFDAIIVAETKRLY